MDETPTAADVPTPQPGSKIPSLAGLVVVVGLAFGAFFIFRSDEGVVEFRLSEPKADVQFQIDGKDTMLSADASAKLPRGVYDLKVLSKEYEPVTLSFRVVRGHNVVKVDLRKKPKPPEPVVKIDPAEVKRKQVEAAKLLDDAAKFLDDARTAAAEPLVTKALELDPTSARGQALRGLIHLYRDNLQEAEKDFDLVLKQDPKLALALQGKSAVHLRREQWDDSITEAIKALAADSELAAAYVLRGEAWLRKGELTKGLSDCDAAVKRNPKLIRALQNRSLAHASLGQWAKALDDLNTLQKLDFELAYLHLVKSEVLARQDNLDLAKKERTIALKLDSSLAQRITPVFPPIPKKDKGPSAEAERKAADLVDKARNAFELFNYDLTMELAEAALKLDPFSAQALAWRAAVHLIQDDKSQAKRDCDQAIKLDSGTWRAYLTRAHLYEEKDAHKIVADATVVVTLAPKERLGYTRRAFGYLRRNEYPQVIADCQAALKLNLKEAAAYRYLGEAYAFQGNFDPALANYDQYIKLEPKDAHGYLYRAGVYLKKEDRTKARADMKKVEELDEDLAKDEPPVFPDPPKEKVVPTTAKQFALRAQGHLKAGKLDSAIADWTLALRLEPAWYFDRGLAYVERGDFEQALADFDQEALRDATKPELYWQRAALQARVGNYRMAIDEISRAAALEPKNAKYVWQRAGLHRQLGNLLLAAEDQAAAVQLDPAYESKMLPVFEPPEGRAVRPPAFIPWGGSK